MELEMMIAIDTDEKFKWFLDALESDDFQVVSRKLTKEDDEEICKAIDEYKAMRQESLAKAEPFLYIRNTGTFLVDIYPEILLPKPSFRL